MDRDPPYVDEDAGDGEDGDEDNDEGEDENDDDDEDVDEDEDHLFRPKTMIANYGMNDDFLKSLPGPALDTCHAA